LIFAESRFARKVTPFKNAIPNQNQSVTLLSGGVIVGSNSCLAWQFTAVR
jgi:hypothetical protein